MLHAQRLPNAGSSPLHAAKVQACIATRRRILPPTRRSHHWALPKSQVLAMPGTPLVHTWPDAVHMTASQGALLLTVQCQAHHAAAAPSAVQRISTVAGAGSDPHLLQHGLQLVPPGRQQRHAAQVPPTHRPYRFLLPRAQLRVLDQLRAQPDHTQRRDSTRISSLR